jgi:hypothetical protein
MQWLNPCTISRSLEQNEVQFEQESINLHSIKKLTKG